MKTLVAVGSFLLSLSAFAGNEIAVYKSPTCGCCTKWEEHLTANGFKVTSNKIEDVSPIKDKHAVPESMRSCHTGIIDGYAVEGHVPAEDIKKFLAKKPKGVKGIAVPGMPMGSPGMEGATVDKYDVLTFTKDGTSAVFSKH